MNGSLLTQIASDAVLQQAYDWLCKRRKDYPAQADVWHLRWHWPQRRPQLQADLRQGRYRFGPLQRVRGREATMEIWSASDALVLKAMALVLGRHLKPHLSPRCFHLADHGGAKAAVRQTAIEVTRPPFIFRTDVKQYYANIDHGVLEGLLRQHINEEPVLRLIQGYLQRTVVDDDWWETARFGPVVGLSAVAADGCVVSQAAGRPHGCTGLVLRPVYGRLGGVGANPVETAAGGAGGQRDAERTKGGTAPG